MSESNHRNNNKILNHGSSRRVLAVAILLVLIVLAFILVRPFLIAIILGLILAFILNPVYLKLNKFIKSKTACALLITLVILIIVAIGLFFIAQITIKEAFNLYMQIQKVDFYSMINNLLSKVFESPDLSRQITTTIQQGIISLTSSFTEGVGNILTNAPYIILQFFVVFFVAYYALRDSPKIINYLKEVLPFSPEVNERLLKRSRELTHATIYGQVIVGLVQGAVAGIGFYIFGAPSPLLFTMLAILLSIIPFIGPALVWVPLSLLMIATGNLTNGILLFVFGVAVVSWIDNLLKPSIVGKKGKINEIVALVGMIGGIALIGPVGLVIGPLILGYLLLFIELYRTGHIRVFA